MGRESQEKARRRGDEKAQAARRLAKRVKKIQRVVDYRLGPVIVARYRGKKMDSTLMASVRGFVLRSLRELNVDMSGLEVYPHGHGNQLQIEVGPWAPVVVGREDSPTED